jgi:hypothetical protein
VSNIFVKNRQNMDRPRQILYRLTRKPAAGANICEFGGTASNGSAGDAGAFGLAFAARMMEDVSARCGAENQNPSSFKTNAPFVGLCPKTKGAGSCKDPALVGLRRGRFCHYVSHRWSGRTLAGQAASPGIFGNVSHGRIEGSIFPFLCVGFHAVHHQLGQFDTGRIQLAALRPRIRRLIYAGSPIDPAHPTTAAPWP